MSLFHHTFMARAIQIAKHHKSSLKTNPRVGAVIVYNSKIIGEGAHQKYGEPHAEINAINSVTIADQHLIQHSTIYVTLEPCSHYGKTPPCAAAIIKHKFKRVIISTLDPSKKINGQGLKLLREAGIEVIVGCLETEGIKLVDGFKILAQSNRPKVILKYAMSEDGLIGRTDIPVWLTNPISKRWVHRLRSEVGAIIVGKNTVRIDNPKLDTRFGFGESPLRIIPDRRLNLDKNLAVFTDDNPTLILTSQQEINSTRKDHSKEVLSIDFDNFYAELFRILKDRRIKTLLVEGGAKMLQGFMDAGYWDEAFIFKVGKKLETGVLAPVLPLAKLALRTSIRKDSLEHWVPSDS